jgi:hypothetical protein
MNYSAIIKFKNKNMFKILLVRTIPYPLIYSVIENREEKQTREKMNASAENKDISKRNTNILCSWRLITVTDV